MIEINRVSNGYFKSYKNGEETPYVIINGSMGMSGIGNNVYGIENMKTGSIKWFGTLHNAKKTLIHWISKM